MVKNYIFGVILGLLCLAGLPAQGQVVFEDNFSEFAINTTRWPSTLGATRSFTQAGCATSAGRAIVSGGFSNQMTTQGITAPGNGTLTIAFTYTFGATFGAPALRYGTGATLPATWTNLVFGLPTSSSCITQSHELTVTAGTTYWIRWQGNNSTTGFTISNVTITYSGSGGGGGPCATASSTACTVGAGTSNRLVSKACGDGTDCDNWDFCTTTCGGSCTVWSSAVWNTRRMSVRHNIEINTVRTSGPDMRNIQSIYIDPGASLAMNAAWTGNTSGTYEIRVCGTLNVAPGTSTCNFDNHNLVINSGGVVNLNSGTLRVRSITVNSGGTLNFEGGSLRSNHTIGDVFIVNEGGQVNINNSSSGGYTRGGLSARTRINGTWDCKNNLTSTTRASAFSLGGVMVTNSTSTGLIRTQTPFIPSHNFTVDFNNNFFGSNSNYGGTVEYYGSSNITLQSFGTGTRRKFYSVDVNLTGGAKLFFPNGSEMDIMGILRMQSGNLSLNGSTLRMRGSFRYGTGAIEGSATSNIYWQGHSTANDVSVMLATEPISFKGTTVTVLNPELRFAPSFRNLGNFHLYRWDVVNLTTDLNIHNELHLESGIVNTAGVTLHVLPTDSAAVLHETTGWVNAGWISGNLRRNVTPGTHYDFPVGYQGIGIINHPNRLFIDEQLKYRRYTLELNSATGMNYVDVRFNRPADECEGDMPVIEEDGIEYTGVHPEGYWVVNPDGGSSIDYNARLYVHGFMEDKELVDNEFGGIKRPDGTACADWSIDGGDRPGVGQPGRITQEQSPQVHLGYALRTGWTSFSEQAIGVGGGDAPLSSHALRLKGNKQSAGISLNWKHDATDGQEQMTYELTVRRDAAGAGEPEKVLATRSGCMPECQYLHIPSQPGTYTYRVQQTQPDGKVLYSNPVQAVWQGSHSAYPNPVTANRSFVLSLSATTPADISLVNTLGQTVWHTTLSGTQDLRVTAPPVAGQYLLRVVQGGTAHTTRLMVTE